MPTLNNRQIRKALCDKKADKKYGILTRAQIQKLLDCHRAAISKQAICNLFRKNYGISCTTQEVQRFFERLGLDTSDWVLRVRRKEKQRKAMFFEGVELSSHLKLLLEGLESKNRLR